jgi:ClpP class serine protease
MNYLLAEAQFVHQLRADRKELLELSKELGGLAERRKARAEFFAELAASGSIFLAPTTGQDPKTLYTVDASGVAHIQIKGELTPVAQQDVCGGYTAQALTEYGYIMAATMAAQDDPTVSSIDYHVDSPGGYVSGVDECAQCMAACTVPTRVASSPASRVGSIGVLAEEYNQDRALADMGIDHNVYTSTDAPLKHADTSTPEGKAQIVAELDQLHTVFVSRVADGRGVPIGKVSADFGQGALVIAADALKAGMIDQIQGMNIGRKPMNMEKKGGVAALAERPIKTKGSVKMTLEQLKADHPEAYQSAMAVGMELGVKAERTRVEELAAWEDVSPACAAIVADAKATGKSYSQVASQLSAAAAKGPKAAANDNPPKVSAFEAPKASTEDAGDPASEAAFLAMAAKNGYTPEQAKKYLGKGA